MTRFLAQSEPTLWMPEQASTFARDVDWLFNFIGIVSIIFFVGIGFCLFFFAWKYRRGDKKTPGHTHNHNTTLEITWSVIPLIIVLLIFVWGFRGLLDMTTPPANNYEILVTSYKWGWEFTYPNGVKDANLHVPADKPIYLVLESRDVIHSFFVPAFRVKKDLVPGRYNKTWFQAESDAIGLSVDNPYEAFTLYCAEYCGTNHSQMLADVVVHTPESFEKWMEVAMNWQEGLSPLEIGTELYTRKACNTCHSLDGSSGNGPTFQDQYGYPIALKDGSSPIVDDEFLRQGIVEPNSHGIAGYNPVMPKIALTDSEVTALVTFIKAQSDKWNPADADPDSVATEVPEQTEEVAESEPQE